MRIAASHSAPQNLALAEIFADGTHTLVIGMSLTDPNIKRVLYEARRLRAGNNLPPVTVIMRAKNRKHEGLLRAFWSKQGGVNPLFVADYEEVPELLRTIQWGIPLRGEAEYWLSTSTDWVEKCSSITGATLFNPESQKRKKALLRNVKAQLTIRFAIPNPEKIELTVFVPIKINGPTKLCLIADSRKGGERNQEPLEEARIRSLAITRDGSEGLAGLSFVSGTDREVLDEEAYLDQNFDDS